MLKLHFLDVWTVVKYLEINDDNGLSKIIENCIKIKILYCIQLVASAKFKMRRSRLEPGPVAKRTIVATYKAGVPVATIQTGSSIVRRTTL